MKIFLGIGTIFLVIFLTGIAQAKDEIVTSEKLIISDVVLSFTSSKTGQVYTQKTGIGQPVVIPEKLGTFVIKGLLRSFKFKGHDVGDVLIGILTPLDGDPVEVALPLRFPSFDKIRKGNVLVAVVERKELAPQTGKHKQNAPEPAQRLSDAKQESKQMANLKPSGTKFKITKCYKKKSRNYVRRQVIGYVPPEIDITDDLMAKHILREAASYALTQKECSNPYPGGENYAIIFLHSQNKKYKSKRGHEVWATVGPYEHTTEVLLWNDYLNHAKQRFLAEKRRAEKEEKRRKELTAREEKRKKELAQKEREKAEAKKRLKQFEKKYGVTDWPVMKEFSVNPFIYEGKKVAFVSEFGTMLSATEGGFECSGELFIVSDIPKGFFTKEAEVVIAGRPLGKKETKLPLLGEVLVPNLKFVGAYFCEEQHCRDIVWK